MATFSERMRELRKEKGISLEKLANILGTTKATLSRYENNMRIPKIEFVQQLANYFDVSVDYLLGKTNIRNTKMLAKAGLYEVDEMIQIPIVGAVHAGINGTVAFEDYLGTENIEKEAVKDGEKYFFLKVKGDSMYPEIKEGDLVFVRQQCDVENGDLAVVIINGDEGIVKRVIKKDNTIILQSINPMYEPIVITSAIDFAIVGKVKRVVRIY